MFDPTASVPTVFDPTASVLTASVPTAFDPTASVSTAAHDLGSSEPGFVGSTLPQSSAGDVPPYEDQSGGVPQYPTQPIGIDPSSYAGGAVPTQMFDSGRVAASSGMSSGPPTQMTWGTASGPAAAPAPRPSDDPLLPLSSSDNELRAAVGVKPKPEPRKRRPPTEIPDDDGEDDDGVGPQKRSRKLVVVSAFSVVIGLGIAALVFLGSANKGRFVIACEPQEVVAGQGRGFPPWGTRSLDDDAKWKPIKIPPEAECRERETEDEDELSRWYLEMLVERASAMLTAKEVTKIDEAAAMLEQALLHARAPERRDQRKDIERLLGDVGYWRASAKLREAATSLTDAAKQFDAAAAQRPRHVSDASAWATHVRKLVDELRAGPAGVAQTAFPPTPPPERPIAPPGVALPIEPGRGSAGSDASAPPAAPPDAGIPSGGVLL